MKPGKIVAAVVAAILALVSFGMIVGGGVLTWASATQRDADGFLTSTDYDFTSPAYAIVSEEVDLGSRPGDWFPDDFIDVRLTATSNTPVFIGIGPSDDVDAYLGSVARDEVDELGVGSDDVTFRSRDGAAPAGAPGAQTFWVASAEGAGTQSVTWEVDSGSWSAVLMNADASQGIAAEFSAGAKIPILIAIAVGLLIFGVLLGIGAALLLVWAVRREGEARPGVVAPTPAVATAAGAYPVVVEGRLDPGLSRWMWLVKWFLAIPHYVVLAFLYVAYVLLTIVAFFAILFTGRYPRGIFDFNVGVLRYQWRVSYYALSVLGTDRYPPFALGDVDYPARLDVAYPEQLSRGLVLVKWWLLAIPHYIIVGLLTSGLIWWTTDFDGEGFLQFGGGLIGILAFVAVIILAFTGRYQQGLFDLLMGLNRWVYRVVAYVSLMRDEYPPFRLDMGGEDPGSMPGGGAGGSGSDEAEAPLPTG
jgi:hypothetical protein